MDWLSPEAGSATHGSLRVSVEITGPSPERVELWVDGTPVGLLSASHSLNWETWSLPEGPEKEFRTPVSSTGPHFESTGIRAPS